MSWMRSRTRDTAVVASLAFGLVVVGAGLAAATLSQTARQDEREALINSLHVFADELTEPPDYIREIYDYARFGRLDPLRPPEIMTSPAAFPDLVLSGIVVDVDDPDGSAAIIRFQASGQTIRRVVRVGDQVNQYTIVGIERDRVLIDVHRYGGAQRIVLERGSAAQR